MVLGKLPSATVFSPNVKMINNKRLALSAAKGFTLIELLVVIVVIGILTSIGFVSFSTALRNARDGQRKADLRQLQSTLEFIRADYGCYPRTSGCVANAWPTACKEPIIQGTAPNQTTYLQALPCDPQTGKNPTIYNGGLYYFTTPATGYVLGACLENPNDVDGTTTNPGGSGTCTSGKYYVLRNL